MAIGCTVGIKEKVRVIYVSQYKIPKELHGAIKIATNKKIPVTIEGKKDIDTTMDLGGYYAIKAQDLKGMLDASNR